MLYVSGEESAAQIKLRAERLPDGALDVPVLAETDLDTVIATLEAERPDVVVIDSVQTLSGRLTLPGAAGTVGQVREVSRPRDHGGRQAATGPPCVLVGHVTKEGCARGARGCSSTSWTACCSSRARRSAPIGRCAR